MRRKRLTITVWLATFAMLFSVQGAQAILIDFTENGWTSYTSPREENAISSDAFLAHGSIYVYDVYQYGDDRDLVDEGIGIAPTNDEQGVIDFVVPTNAVTFDWWFEISVTSPDPLEITVIAYDAGNNVEASFVTSGKGLVSGTETLTGSLISRIVFWNSNNGYEFPAIATLSYEPIPEPVTMLMLGGLGAGLAGARRLIRRK